MKMYVHAWRVCVCVCVCVLKEALNNLQILIAEKDKIITVIKPSI